MKIKKINYKIVSTTKGTYQVYRITSYFGIEWIGEYIGGQFFDFSSAKSFIRLCKDNRIEIKYL